MITRQDLHDLQSLIKVPSQLYYLPFPVPARVVIDQIFATQDLVYGMHQALRYWVLLLQ